MAAKRQRDDRPGFARGGKYEVKSSDINEIINKSVDMFARTKKEITVHKKFQEDIWAVEIDRFQIEQVFLNLYVNARQAMNGTGDLFLETANIGLDECFDGLHGLTAGKYVKISVTDTGIGISAATQQKVFDPFFTTKEKSRGTGLGLASAYGIVRSHAGIINVKSAPGAGATFNIFLPVSEKEPVKETDQESNHLLKGSESILLVDDEAMIIRVGKAMLERLGYQVFTASGGREAIETCQANQQQFDLVILDMIMPDIGGGDTYDQLKVIDPAIKVLLSSGYSIDGEARKIMDRGCNGFIQKPFSLQNFSRKIRDALDGNITPGAG